MMGRMAQKSYILDTAKRIAVALITTHAWAPWAHRVNIFIIIRKVSKVKGKEVKG